MTSTTSAWRTVALSLLSFLLLLPQLFAQSYCIPTSISNSTVNLMSTLTVGNTAVSLPTQNQGYTDNSATIIATVNAGTSLSFTAGGQIPGYTALVSAFIDLNNDATFDTSSERITIYTRASNTSSTTYTYSNTASFSIPASTPSGNYRVRVIANNSTVANPCPGSARVKAIDFTITVNGQACTAPTATYTIVPNCNNNTFNVSVALTSMGNASSVQIKNGNTVLQTVSSAGTYSVGPFTSGTNVSLLVANAANANCASTAQNLTYTCPCTPPTAVYEIVPNCDNNSYTILANITNLGTSSTVAVNLNGNTFSTTANTGTVTLGPFQSGTVQQLNVANAANSSCATAVQGYGFTCPTCVAPTATFNTIDNCAENQYSVTANITSLGSASSVNIYNNGNIIATVTQPGTYTYGPYANTLTSNLSVSNTANAACTTTTTTLSTGCAPCTSASALYNLIEDCLNNQFSVQVALANLGTAQTIEIANGSTVLTTATATGNYTVGPFTNGEQVVLTLTDAANEFCTTTSQTLTSSCPTCVEATATAVIVENCEEQTFTISVDVTDLGSATSIAFYNGTTLIQSVNANGNYVFGPFTIGTTVELNAVNEQNLACTIDFGSYASACTPCLIPTVDFTVIPACFDNQFSIEANITSLGSNTTLTTITDIIVETGIYTFGPYPSGEEIVILLQGNTSNGCFVQSETLTYNCPTCELPDVSFTVVPACEEDGFTIDAIVTSMGSNSTLTSGSTTISQAGTYTFGPYASGEEVVITLLGTTTSSCFVASETLTYTCPTCEAPEATFVTVENCDNEQFYVSISLTSMGNNTEITAENLTIIETGTYTVGPFASAETVYITLVGNITNDCNLISQALTFDCADMPQEPGTSVSKTDFNFAIYPNPSNGVTTIVAEVNGNVTVLDATGKMVDQFTIEAGTNVVNTSSLASGIYTLQIQTKQGNQFKRLSIQH